MLLKAYAPRRTNLFEGTNHWKGGEPFWDAPESGQGYAGIVLLKECRFRDCRFANVGFLPPSGESLGLPDPKRHEQDKGAPTDR